MIIEPIAPIKNPPTRQMKIREPHPIRLSIPLTQSMNRNPAHQVAVGVEAPVAHEAKHQAKKQRNHHEREAQLIQRCKGYHSENITLMTKKDVEHHHQKMLSEVNSGTDIDGKSVQPLFHRRQTPEAVEIVRKLQYQAFSTFIHTYAKFISHVPSVLVPP
jgi:hypothetical protein